MDTNTDAIQVTKVYSVLQEYPWAKDSRVIDIFRTQEAAEDCARELSPDDLLKIYSESPEEAEYYKKTLSWNREEYREDGIFFVHLSAEGEEFDISRLVEEKILK